MFVGERNRSCPFPQERCFSCTSQLITRQSIEFIAHIRGPYSTWKFESLSKSVKQVLTLCGRLDKNIETKGKNEFACFPLFSKGFIDVHRVQCLNYELSLSRLLLIRQNTRQIIL